MQWDDIKVFLEVARSERLSEAARRLSIDASTVSRRLHKLEESLSTKLFERTLDGHILTTDGLTLLDSARKIEQDLNAAYNQITLDNAEHAGLVRIGLTEAFGNHFVAPNLLPLYQKYPNIQIDLLHFARDVKISRNEADIAIAIEKPSNASMIVSKLCDYQLQLYGHANYLKMHNSEITPNNFQEQRWISYVDDLLFTSQLLFDDELKAKVQPIFRSTSVLSQYTAIKSGLGIGILPCFLADQDPSLIKLCPKEVKILRSFYLVTHPESKRLSRVNIVWDHLKQLAHQFSHQLVPLN